MLSDGKAGAIEKVFLDELHGLRIGSALVSMRFQRVGSRCHVDKLDVTGGPLKTEIELD